MYSITGIFQRISQQLQSSQKQPPEVFYNKCVHRNFAEFTGKHLCQSFFFNKVVGLRPATLLKKRLWHRCFPVNFAKLLKTPFLQNTSGRLLLNSDIEKSILMAASEEEFILGTFLHGCFSKATIFVLEIFTHILHFLLWSHVKEEPIFMTFFK